MNYAYENELTSHQICQHNQDMVSNIIGRCLNVAGLRNKLDRGILDHYLSEADLIVLVETNTDDPIFKDTLLEDYKLFVKSKPSSPSGQYKYGGVHGTCVLINN